MKCIYLTNGKVQLIGDSNEVIDTYITNSACRQEVKSIYANGLELVEFKLCTPASEAALTSAIFGEDYELRFKIKGDMAGLRLGPMLRVFNQLKRL